MNSHRIVKIGVTGHRFVQNSDSLTSGVLDTLTSIREVYPADIYSIHTAMAQGSDRLVAALCRGIPRTDLVVVQLVCQGQLLDELGRMNEVNEFGEMESMAARIVRLPDASTPAAAYRCLAKYLAETCDVLIALWNGVYNHKPGGTSDVVALFIGLGKPVYWIYCNNEETGTANPLYMKKEVGGIELI